MTLLHQLDSPLIQRALLEAVLVGSICGLVGVHVLLRRLPFFALALTHSAFPGIVVASALGVNLFIGGAASTAVLIVAVAVVGSIERIDQSTATGVALAAAFATGVLVQSARPAGGKDLSAFLVGDILAVSWSDVATTAVIVAVLVAVLAAFHKELIFSSFDPAGAAASGLPVRALEVVVLSTIGLAAVTSVRAVGTILVLTLLVAPALAARQWTDRIGWILPLSAALGALAGVCGIAASAQWGVAAGASVVLAAVAELAISVGAATVLTTMRRPPQKWDSFRI